MRDARAHLFTQAGEIPLGVDFLGEFVVQLRHLRFLHGFANHMHGNGFPFQCLIRKIIGQRHAHIACFVFFDTDECSEKAWQKALLGSQFKPVAINLFQECRRFRVSLGDGLSILRTRGFDHDKIADLRRAFHVVEALVTLAQMQQIVVNVRVRHLDARQFHGDALVFRQLEMRRGRHLHRKSKMIVRVHRAVFHAEHVENIHVIALRRLLVADAHERILEIALKFLLELFRHDLFWCFPWAEAGKTRLPRVVRQHALTFASHVGGRDFKVQNGAAVRLGLDGDVHVWLRWYLEK